MVDILSQLLAFIILMGGLIWGYRRWAVPHGPNLDFQAKGLLLLIILTFLGGLIGSLFWWMDEARSFAWDLPPLASRMLASAGASFAVGAFFALESPTVRRVRLVLILIATYLVPLIVAVLLFHLNRFDFAASITYSFFIIAGGMAVAALWYLFRQPVILPNGARDNRAASPIVRAWLTFLALLTALWGLALFATDNGPSSHIWAWPGDLLTSRLIGVMLLTIAVGSAWSLRFADLSRLMLVVTTFYGIGLAIASLWNLFSAKPIKLSYLIVFGVVALLSAALSLRERAVDARPVVRLT